MTPKGILLDLDNTLYDADKAYRESLASIGVEPGEFAAARNLVKLRLPKNHVSARNRLLYFKCLLEQRGHYTPSALLELQDRYELALEQNVKNQWQKLARKKLLDTLGARFPMVLVTNENLRTQSLKLRAIDPDAQFFSFLVCSEEFGVEKPALTLFKQALRLLKIPAKECVFVGDDFKADIVPALKLGMHAVLTTEFTPPEEAVLAEKTRFPGLRRIGRLDELRALIVS